MKMSSTIRTLMLATALIGTVAGCAAIRGQETAGEYIDDASITARVNSALLGEPNLKSGAIGVETMQNVVQLSGFVESQQTRSRAGEIARSVQGVRGVRNDLIVR
ncbi:MAG: BON domain-containing protein [Alphaproteobacteria bacterium]|nr:MAG: BON domain-containing protein [Alphaproteobacteria bacterium]